MPFGIINSLSALVFIEIDYEPAIKTTDTTTVLLTSHEGIKYVREIPAMFS